MCCQTVCTYNIGEDVTGGKVKLNITIDNVSLLTQDLDLCDTIDQVDLECPLKKGSHMASISEYLPDDIPPVSPSLASLITKLI